MFKHIVKAMFVLLVSIASSGVMAQVYPRFDRPVSEQTGMYTAQIVNGLDLTDLANSGGILEVLEPGSHPLGITLGTGEYIVWGTIQTPDNYLTYQSSITNWRRYDRSVSIQIGKAKFTDGVASVDILGYGVVRFDPLQTGSGNTVDLEAHFYEPVLFYGQNRTDVTVRFYRIDRGKYILACDRTGIPEGPSPTPPRKLCND